jgi:hypothetical protein
MAAWTIDSIPPQAAPRSLILRASSGLKEHGMIPLSIDSAVVAGLFEENSIS